MPRTSKRHRSTAGYRREQPQTRRTLDSLSRKLDKIPSYEGENFESHWGVFSFTGKVILDVGADYGSTAAFFLMRGAKRVIAVEPNPVYFKRLVSNFRLDPRVIPVQKEIQDSRDLENLIRRFRPNLVKTDCEGCEIHLIHVDPSVLRSVPEYLVETHGHIGIMTRSKVRDLFSRIGYIQGNYEVLPGLSVTHAKRKWNRVSLPENEIVRLRNTEALTKEWARRYQELNEEMRNNPLSALLRVYALRPDLKAAYPEVRTGDYTRLLQWAKEIIDNRIDEHLLLSKFKSWYENNPMNQVPRFAAERDALHHVLLKTTTERDDLQTQLSKSISERDDLQAQLSKALTVRDDLQTQLSKSISERDDLQAQLSKALTVRDDLQTQLSLIAFELSEVKASFGYRAMRFYASRLDRFLPAGTRRGELKRIIVQSTRVAGEQGISNLIRQVEQKVRRREFRIAKISQGFHVEAHALVLETKIRAPPQVLFDLNYPEIAPGKIVTVSPVFVLAGWALSEAGIKHVDVLLDGQSVGPATYGIRRPDIATGYHGFPGSQAAGFRKLITMRSDSGNRHILKIVVVSDDETTVSLEGAIELDSELNIQRSFRGTTELGRGTNAANSSVVLLTKSAPDEFEITLERLRQQQLSGGLEIIIMNSGPYDLSSLSSKYDCKILRIPPEEFNHSRTRNYGAKNAINDYVFFIVDDAIPASNHLLADMISTFESDPRLAAVSARQIPRSDADLMACQAIWGYYYALGLQWDRIASSSNFDKLTSIQKRQVSQIDDVCSCFRKSILLKYGFNEKIAYAEDLELGVRLIRDGYKIAHSFSSAVIHSHNRQPSYYLRRAYVETKTLTNLLEYDLTGPKALLSQGPVPVQIALNQVRQSYDSLCLVVDGLREANFYDGNIQKIFDAIETGMRNLRNTIEPEAENVNLAWLLLEIENAAHHVRTVDGFSNRLLNGRYVGILRLVEEWMLNTSESLIGREQEFVDCLYKVLGSTIGEFLGECYVILRLTKQGEHTLEALDNILSGGV